MRVKFGWDWIAVVFAILGILFNAEKSIWCWPCYIGSNITFVLHFWPKKEYPYIFLMVVYFFLNIFAWIKWASM
jgi:nicotinamide riboside transporter PnuC